MPGEIITIELHQNGKTLVEASWSTDFPLMSASFEFKSAEVRVEDLLEKLLHLSAFTPEDLAELSHSRIPEVRIGAVANLTDQALLAKVAIEDKEPDVRRAAVDKLTDQALLAKMAIEDKEPYVRRTAVEKLTDQVVLAKVAFEDKDDWVRKAANVRIDELRR